jgi:hypothetical protein
MMGRVSVLAVLAAMLAGCGAGPGPGPAPPRSTHPRTARLAGGSEAVVNNLDAEGGELFGPVTMKVDGEDEPPELDHGTRVGVLADLESVDRDPFRYVQVEVRDGKHRGRKGGVKRLALAPAR